MSAKVQKKRVKLEIKSEKDDLHPISHYIDDRVELVKQIFSCLKPKTIKHLAPEFLKDSPLEEMEELCLNELLGLSTKRLLSIINATKCPTDTESSSDSDIHNVDEHISLEEISTDSESGKNNANKSNKAKRNRTIKKQQGANDKSVSVLELLELQARARAIRSQLALEPVAKIEVDSDDSTDGDVQSTDTSNVYSNKINENQHITSQQNSAEKVANGIQPSAESTRPIKLKRNFRKQNRSDYNDDETQNIDKKEGKNENIESVEVKNKAERIENDQKKTRSPSPDVITILPSPETLCISDSSDEGDNDISNVPITACKGSETNLKQLALDRQKDETNSSPPRNQEEQQVDDDNTKPEEGNSGASIATEIEEGEIIEKEAPQVKATKETINEIHAQALDEKQIQGNTKEENTHGQIHTDQTLKSDNDVDAKQRKSGDQSSENSTPHCSNKQADRTGIDHSIQRNDDLISIMDDDFDETAERVNSKQVKLEKMTNMEKECVANEQIDNDIITLHNSSDEESTFGQFTDSKESQSWNSRWLKSNRVSKILATSRLGNRVREKIKKIKKQNEDVEEVGSTAETIEAFHSQFEDGSVQQYAEILERTS